MKLVRLVKFLGLLRSYLRSLAAASLLKGVTTTLSQTLSQSAQPHVPTADIASRDVICAWFSQAAVIRLELRLYILSLLDNFRRDTYGDRIVRQVLSDDRASPNNGSLPDPHPI